MKIGDKVRLKTFNGTKIARDKRNPQEDYWKLVGETGIIKKDTQERSLFASFSKEQRVLVRFDKILKDYGLVSHNNIENSLWILVSDLEILD